MDIWLSLHFNIFADKNCTIITTDEEGFFINIITKERITL
jgi:hypothetical protein